MQNDAKIMQRLSEHKKSALAATPCGDWFVICLQGSQNYGLANENSDVDTRLLTLPSMQELTLNKKPISKTHIMENNEHCDVKDVREYFQIFRKSNINFVEILFTDYWLANDKYIHIWLDIKAHAEKLARYNPCATLCCIKGMAQERFKNLCNEDPLKYGYNPKQLSYLFYLKYFVDHYIAGDPYTDCLYVKEPETQETLLQLKQNGLKLTKESAIELAEDTFKYICKKVDTFNQYNVNKSDEELDNYLNETLCNLVFANMTEKMEEYNG